MKASLCLAFLAVPLCAQVKITQGSDRITVDVDGKPFTAFFIGAETQKPYLHPLRSPSGKIVTRGFPMETIEGESKDHPHHRGLWFTHGDVNGFDFWANEAGQRSVGPKGRVVVRKVGELKGGKKSGSIDTTFDWNAPDGKALLTETRRMTFYAGPGPRVMDFDITLRAIQKCVFGDTKEGTFAVRLAAGLEEVMPRGITTPKRTGRMVDSEGRSGEKAVWGKRAPWVDYAGELEGEKLGLAIFDHPGNPKHPTYWHSRSYGLFAANIFGEHDFYNDKTKNGGVTVEPGGTLRFRYRVLIHTGDAASGIAEAYKKFAAMK